MPQRERTNGSEQRTGATFQEFTYKGLCYVTQGRTFWVPRPLQRRSFHRLGHLARLSVRNPQTAHLSIWKLPRLQAGL